MTNQTNNTEPTSKHSTNCGGCIGFVIIVLLILWLVKSCGGLSVDSNDNKCDVCNKASYAKLYGDEYCKKHWEKAINHYLND